MSLPRRRFQFSLRTLFVVVTVLGVGLGWVGRQVNVVRERKAMRERIVEGDGIYAELASLGPSVQGLIKVPPPEVSWFRYWLGDRAVAEVLIDAPKDELDQIQAAFPEASVYPRQPRPTHD